MTASRHRLDLRDLEPPEPMRRALEAVEMLGAGAVIETVTDREPLLLHRELERRGHLYATNGSAGSITTTIWRKEVSS